MLRRVLTTGLLVLLAAAATAADIIQDTKENRVLQAQRVVTGTPIEETLEGIVQEAIKIKGPEVAGVRARPRRVCVSCCNDGGAATTTTPTTLLNPWMPTNAYPNSYPCHPHNDNDDVNDRKSARPSPAPTPPS